MENIITHILLIEDDLDDQEIFLSALAGLDGLIACETFADGGEALDNLRSGRVCPDIIFLDLKMEGINGFEFMNQIRRSAKLRTIPIIIISDSDDPLDIEMSKIAGARKFITKPRTFKELSADIAFAIEAFTHVH
ncbi:MAG: response regulator [Chitinophagaceae bacterium]|nr:MAG: response regulator [Chitinophagaceae bacterium]